MMVTPLGERSRTILATIKAMEIDDTILSARVVFSPNNLWRKGLKRLRSFQ
jgi:hypothetical protein